MQHALGTSSVNAPGGWDHAQTSMCWYNGHANLHHTEFCLLLQLEA